MKLLRYGPKGAEKPGLLDAEGTIRDLSQRVDDIGPEALAGKLTARLSAIDPSSLPPVDPDAPASASPQEPMGELVITAQDTRSQARNREAAIERLRELVRQALVPPKPRRPTKPGRGAVERRLKAKREAGEKKDRRRWRPSE